MRTRKVKGLAQETGSTKLQRLEEGSGRFLSALGQHHADLKAGLWAPQARGPPHHGKKGLMLRS